MKKIKTKIYRLKDIFKWTSGKPIECLGGSIPVYGSNGIIGYTDKAKYNNRIILGRVGAYCGSVEYCRNDFNATDNTLITECDENIITYEYAFYILKIMHLNLYAGGSAQPLITQCILGHIKCELPDICIQNKITNILNNYDKLIENNNRRIKLLETMAEELYKEWFVRFRFPKAKKETKHRIVSKGYVYGNNINGLNAPKSWNYKKLNSIGEFVRGRNITQEEMQEGNIEVISAGIEPSGFHNEYNVNGQSLTISASGANAGYLSYHLDNIWAADCSYYNGNYIWFIYHSLHFIKSVINNLQVGSAQPHVYAKNVNNLFIIVPDINTINEFENRVKNIYSEIKVLKSKNNVLIKQRDYLLPRLMSGKLSVENKNII